MQMRVARALGLLCFAFAAASPGAVSASPAMAAGSAPELRILLKPSDLDPAAATARLDVTMTVPDMHVAAGQPLFEHQSMAPRMTRPQQIVDLTVTDGVGIVPVTDDGRLMRWTSTRSVNGEMTVHYGLKIDKAEGGILATIPRVEGSSLFGVGNMLLVAPNSSTRYRIAIRWDLSAMPPGSTAVSSFGSGDVRLPAGPLSRLTLAMFLAGDVQRQPVDTSSAFSAVWTGDPKFDVRSAMRWSQQLYHWMSTFFGDPAEPMFHVFLRANATNPGNGVAAPHAFTISYGDQTTADSVKTTLGHEMTHTWTATDIGKWYDEGNAVYYQTLLPWRAGLIPIEQRLADINTTAARYYTNTVIAAPDAEILPRFWSDHRYNILPYDRGALYFAVLDGKIRRKSRGKRSVDDLVRTMVARIRAEQPVTEEIWVGLLRQELGDDGVAFHQGMLAGQTVIPASGDYGPCFQRLITKVRRYDPGFGGPQITAHGVVEKLRPDSEAAKAGLRDGDLIEQSTSADALLRDPAMLQSLTVKRDGKTLTISYLPRGAAVDVYQWERAPVVNAALCR